MLHRRGCPLLFTTNALEPPAEQAARLARCGIPARPEEIVQAPMVLLRYLEEQMPGATLFVIGDPPLLEALSASFRLSDDPTEIDVVIASCDRSFDYRKLTVGFQALKRGARFIATNDDPVAPVEGGELPDAGAVIGALEGCSGRKVEAVVGKPSLLFARVALERLGRPAPECVVVGDSLKTDILMGHRAGMRTALVLTGVTRPDELKDAPVQPDFVLESIAALGVLSVLSGEKGCHSGPWKV